MPLVSIIVPCFNCVDYIQETIESVISQTFIDWELLLIDDCSTDSTLSVLDEFASKDKRIRVIALSNNNGAGIARNKGLDASSGRYIAFLDADDTWLPQKLELQLQCIDSANTGISHCSYQLIDENGNKLKGGVKVSPFVDLKKMMCTTEIGMSTSIIDKKIVGDFRFNKMRTRQDARLWMDLLSKNNFSAGLDKALVSYRVRKGQISRNKFKMAYRTFLLYVNFKKIPLYLRLWYFLNYIKNAVVKRL